MLLRAQRAAHTDPFWRLGGRLSASIAPAALRFAALSMSLESQSRRWCRQARPGPDGLRRAGWDAGVCEVGPGLNAESAFPLVFVDSLSRIAHLGLAVPSRPCAPTCTELSRRFCHAFTPPIFQWQVLQAMNSRRDLPTAPQKGRIYVTAPSNCLAGYP